MDVLGDQFNLVCASVISGFRLSGSSCGNGKCIQPLVFDGNMSTRSFMVISLSGLPRLVHQLYHLYNKNFVFDFQNHILE